MATGLNFLKSYFLASESTTSSFVTVDPKIGLESQYTLQKPLGDCLNCSIRKGKWREAPISRFPIRGLYLSCYLT